MSEIKNNQEMNLNEMEQTAGGAGARYMVYTVVKGDNLTKIARAYGVTVDQLVSWNRIKNPNLIVVGQELKIYI